MNKGFTLIEILVVILLIGIMSAVQKLPDLKKYRVRRTKTRKEIYIYIMGRVGSICKKQYELTGNKVGLNIHYLF